MTTNPKKFILLKEADESMIINLESVSQITRDNIGEVYVFYKGDANPLHLTEDASIFWNYIAQYCLDLRGVNDSIFG
ncbi:MAG: hypothetical protein HEQ19_13920 [Gloeotrichia echinulata CP02]|jgi:hypothetical protein|nr:hypothetical protein [Gloeotrichia echinulata DEX184]